MLKKYIAIAGNIGVGKSTMVDFLCRTYHLVPFYEPNDFNPYLEDFYDDMEEWAFKSQIHFLSHKFRIHQELTQEAKPVIQDRSIYEDAEVFATHLHKTGVLDDRDFETYYEMYQTILKSLTPPDLMIYLECPIKTIKKRIKERGRPSEQNIPNSYLKHLNCLYEDWIDRYDHSPIIRISTENLDYIQNFLDRGDLLERIETVI